MGPSQHAVRTLAEAVAADPELALELTVSPRTALGRHKALFMPEDYHALATFITMLLEGERQPHKVTGATDDIALLHRHASEIFQSGDAVSEQLPPTVHVAGTPAQVERFGISGSYSEQSAPSTHPGNLPSHVEGFGPAGSDDEPFPAGSETLNLTDSGQRYFARSISRGETVLDALLDWRGLSDGVTADFSSPQSEYEFPAEAQLFMQDPEDFARGFDPTPDLRVQNLNHDDPILTDSAQIAHNVQSWPIMRLPRVASLLSPALKDIPSAYLHKQGQAPFDPTTARVQLTTNDFFEGVMAASGTVSAPDGSGSVKAVKLQSPGKCTGVLQFGALFGAGSGPINLTSVIQQLCSKARVFIKFVIGIPLIRRGQVDTDVRHQFLLHTDMHVESSGFGCDLRGSVLYDLVAPDGIIALRTNAVAVSAYSGGGCDDFNLALPFPSPDGWITVHQLGAKAITRVVFRTLLRSGLNKILRLVQTFRPLPIDTCSISEVSRFDEDIMGDGHLAADSPLCLASRAALCDLIRAGFTAATGASPNGTPGGGCALTVSDPNLDEQRVQLMYSAVNALDVDGNLKFWRCATTCNAVDNENIDFHPKQVGSVGPTFDDMISGFTDPPNFNPQKCDAQLGNCVFVSPVRRMNMNPDSLELISFDNERDWMNAALGAYYANIGATLIGATIGPSLCNYTRPTDGPLLLRTLRLFIASSLGC